MIPIYLFSRLKVVNIEEHEGVIVYMLNQTFILLRLIHNSKFLLEF